MVELRAGQRKERVGHKEPQKQKEAEPIGGRPISQPIACKSQEGERHERHPSQGLHYIVNTGID